MRWNYTKTQQKWLKLLKKEKERYAKRVVKLIAEKIPEKHQQIAVFDAMRVDLEVAYRATQQDFREKKVSRSGMKGENG